MQPSNQSPIACPVLLAALTILLSACLVLSFSAALAAALFRLGS